MDSICNICGKPEEITGTDGAGELTYKPHKHESDMDSVDILLPIVDIEKTLGLLKAIYPERQASAELDVLLQNVICNQLCAYRREMINYYKRGDKKKGKELEQWL